MEREEGTTRKDGLRPLPDSVASLFPFHTIISRENININIIRYHFYVINKILLKKGKPKSIASIGSNEERGTGGQVPFRKESVSPPPNAMK